MSITDQQFETIILRLESGESMASVQADFPHLQDDLSALEDLQDFFAAQRLDVKPDPNGLKSVLRQVTLLSETRGDDEFSWGSFFASFKRPLGVALPAIMVLGVSGYIWKESVPSPQVLQPSQVETVSLEAPIASKSAGLEMASNRAVVFNDVDAVVAKPEMDMEALVQSLSDEFASDMADFENTKADLEPLFTEQLFSYNPDTTL